MLTKTLVFFSLSSVFGMGSSLAWAQTPGLDINDVAVLFPLDSQAKTVPHLPLGDSRNHDAFLSETVFQSVIVAAKRLGVAEPFPAKIDTLADWDIVGYRVDPCAPIDNTGPGESCTAELRLVAQPSTSVFGPADSALHILYDIEKDATGVYRALWNLKQTSEKKTLSQTTGKPLGVHPLLQLAAMSSQEDILDLHAAFLRNYAVPSRVKKVTLMGLRESLAVDWIFLGGDVVDGVWTQGTIPNLKKGDDGFIEFDLRRDGNSINVEPLDKTLSTYDFFSVDIPPSAFTLKTLSQAAQTLENPALSNRNTADCMSCHSATSMRIHPIAGMPLFEKGFSAGPVPGISAYPEPLALQNHELHWNLRAFGYFDQKATLSMRAVNEAARSADAINKTLGWKNPAEACVGLEEEVLACFIRTSTQEGPQKTSEECLAICREKEPRPGSFLNDFLNRDF